MSISGWILSSISVCSGENRRGSTLWLPLCIAHIYCNFIFLKFLLVALLLNYFCFMASLLKKQGEAGVELEEVGKIWKPRRDLGGTLITTQVQSSECIRP